MWIEKVLPLGELLVFCFVEHFRTEDSGASDQETHKRKQSAFTMSIWRGRWILFLLALHHILCLYVHGFAVETPGGRFRHHAAGFTVLKASSSASTTTKAQLSNTNDFKKKSQNKKQKSLSTRRQGETTQPITEQELVDHVSSLYMLPEDSDDTVVRTEDSAANANQRFQRFPALVLNADYQPTSYLPLSLFHWQDAIKAVFSGKVTVVDVYPDTFVRAARLEIPLPSVIALNDYVRTTPTTSSSRGTTRSSKNREQDPAFTRRNVFLRDGYRCQYCALHFHTRDLSLDHVVPRSMGGRLTWNNAVTCCRQCNGRKGSLLPHQLKSVGMKLLAPPLRPSQHQLAQRAGQMLPRRVHPSWKPYLSAVLVMDAEEQEP